MVREGEPSLAGADTYLYKMACLDPLYQAFSLFFINSSIFFSPFLDFGGGSNFL